MKKINWLLVVILIITLCGCHANNNNTIDQLQNGQTNSSETPVKSENIENISIILENLNQIDDINAIIQEADNEKATAALLNLRGTGLKTKEDLVRFLELICDLPILDLIDGEVSTISYMKGLAEDTKAEYEFAYITIKAQNGNWVRYEYSFIEDLTITDNNEITSSEQNITIFSKPVNAADGKLKVFSQEIKDHASGVGKLFTWSANIEGISTRIVYYSQDETQLSIDEVFSDINVVITGDLAS